MTFAPALWVLRVRAIAAFGFTAGTLKAQEVSNQPGLRDILTDLAAGRNVSARVSLPLTIGFFNGQTALYITPEVGVDPSAGASTVAAAQQIAVGFNANFIPQNFASLAGSGAVDDIFVFTNFNQGNVLASAPNPGDRS
jgi:Na+/H+-dicarboxylate symporter